MNGAEWLDQYGVTFDWSANGFHVDADGWEHHRYTLELTNGVGEVIRFPWRQGMAVDDEPTPDTTLWAVASDIRSGELDWHDFADEFGYDEHDAPLSQYRTWEACRGMATAMRDWCDMPNMLEDFREISEDDE